MPQAPQEGLLAEWRRLTPMLRLRANRYFEPDPAGDAGGRAGRTSGAGRAADPVARQLEQQIRLVYDRLTGDADIQEDEVAARPGGGRGVSGRARRPPAAAAGQLPLR